MNDQYKTSAEIEREIEDEREGLTSTLDRLTDKFSFEGIGQQINDRFGGTGDSDIVGTTVRAVRDNPVAVGLVGVGLAWLIYGTRGSSEPTYDTRDSRYAAATAHRPARPAPQARAVYRGPKPEFQDLPAWAVDDHDDDDSGRSYGDRARDAARDARGRAADTAETVGDTARSYASSASGAISSAAGTVSDRAGRMRARLSEGTEHLSEGARERVIAARARAVDLRDRAGVRMAQGRDRAESFYEQQPLVVGALAVAAGAALAATLPRTRLENEYLGSYSDDLMDEAERILHDETEKAKAVGYAVRDEAEQMYEEAKGQAKEAYDDARARVKDSVPSAEELKRTVEGKAAEVRDSAAKSAENAGERLADTAKQEAKKEDLGSGK